MISESRKIQSSYSSESILRLDRSSEARTGRTGLAIELTDPSKIAKNLERSGGEVVEFGEMQI